MIQLLIVRARSALTIQHLVECCAECIIRERRRQRGPSRGIRYNHGQGSYTFLTEAGPGCSCVSNQGRNGPSLSGGLGAVGCMTCSLLVTVAIAAMDRRTEAMANPLYPADRKSTRLNSSHSQIS